MSYLRVYMQSNVSAWFLLALLMVVYRGDLSGYTGLLLLLAIAIPGVWGALRLEAPSGNWTRRLGVNLLFGLALGLGVVLILIGSLFTLRLLGWYAREGQTSSGMDKLLVFGSIPVINYLAIRSLKVISGTVRVWGWCRSLARGMGLSAILVSVGLGAYLWASRPYTAHASQFEPRPLGTALLADFSQGSAGWESADPSINLHNEVGVLRLTAAPSTLF